jgi:hypothetical protein
MLLVVLAAIALLTGPIAANSDKPDVPDAWQLGPDTTFQFWRFDGEYSPAEQKVYFLGGRLADGSTDGSVWSFDPVTGASADTGVDMTVPVSNHTIALLQDSTGWGLYIFGGRDNAGTATTAVQVYYPATNTVAQVSSDAFPLRSPSDCVPIGSGVTVYNNKAYVFGGYAPATAPCAQDEMADQTWVFDPMAAAGSKWTNANAPLSLARAYIAAATLNGMVYALGGDVLGGQLLEVRPNAERLDPANIAAGWQAIADMPTPSGGALPGCDEGQAFGLESPYTPNGVIVYAGCGQWPDELPDTFIYTASSNTWAASDLLNQDRRNHAGAFVPPLGTASTPAIWVFDGRQDSDTNILTSTEYWTVSAPPPQQFLFLPLVLK